MNIRIKRRSRASVAAWAMVAGLLLAIMVPAVALASDDAADKSQQDSASDDAKDKSHEDDGGHWSRIPEGAGRGYNPGNVPDRPGRLNIFGDPFLGTGHLQEGFRTPGGAIVQPSLYIYGTYRTALQSFHQPNSGQSFDTVNEWANRLDIFGNLQLTGTERIVIGLMPLDKREKLQFTGYSFDPESDPRGAGIDNGWVNGFNANVTTAFFEGEFGSVFRGIRGWEPENYKKWDVGFSVGRQPIAYQEGMLINDFVDAVGITANSIPVKGGSNLQITGLWGFGELNADNNLEQGGRDLFGLFTSMDFPTSTVSVDAVYTNDSRTGNDGLFWAVSSVQRIGYLNTAFRVLGSHASQQDSDAVSDGYLLFAQTSYTPAYTEDSVYLNVFWGIDHFASASRDPAAGGPLGQVGINFASPALGRYGSPISSRADESAGFALGREWLFDDSRKQFILELAGKHYMADSGFGVTGNDVYSVAGRYQQAIGQHLILDLEVFAARFDTGGDGNGARVELQYFF